MQPPRRHRYPGRKPLDDRAALAGIVFVLRTGITWNQLPRELIGCSGVTCWRRMELDRGWRVWPALHELLLAELRAAGQLDLDRCAVDASHVHALKGGIMSGPRRSTAATRARKHHLIVEAHGIPLAVTLTGGNRHDVTQLLPRLDAVPPIRGRRGRPRRKPCELFADRGFAWLHAVKRLRTRYERRADLHLGLLPDLPPTTHNITMKRFSGHSRSVRGHRTS